MVQGSRSCTIPECQRPQLYDLSKDPGEREDLAKLRPDVLADLQQRFLEWHQSIVLSRREESKCTHVSDINLSLPGMLAGRSGTLLPQQYDTVDIRHYSK